MLLGFHSLLLLSLLVAAGFGNYFVWDRYNDMSDDDSLEHYPRIWMAVWSILYPAHLVFAYLMVKNMCTPFFSVITYISFFAIFSTVVWGGVVLGENYRNLEDNYRYFWILSWFYEVAMVVLGVVSFMLGHYGLYQNNDNGEDINNVSIV